MSSGRQAQVLYDYEAQDDDQLSIKAGDIIIVVDDSAQLNGWALAQFADKEGYVPAEYVRYIDSQYDNNFASSDTGWKLSGFEAYYENVLSQEHRLPFTFKLCKAVREVLVPLPCTKYGYVMARSDLRKSAILSLIFAFVISVVDAFSILSSIIPVTDQQNGSNFGAEIVCAANIIFRILLTLIFIKRYPRPNLIFVSFPFLNIIASLTYSIRVYEVLEMGDNKEYDGYRFYRTWMWSSALNIPFAIISLVLLSLNKSSGLIAVSIFVVVWNLLNVGRCYLAQWANRESGNEIHPDFETTIKKYHL